MHSTVQTGLYTPNIFNYDYNYHHPNPSATTHTYHHFPPPPHGHHHNNNNNNHHHHQQHNNNNNNNKHLNHSKHNLCASSLALNKVSDDGNGLSNEAELRKKKLNLSTSNISKLKPNVFSSNHNINDLLNRENTDVHKKNSITSNSSVPAHLLGTTTTIASRRASHLQNIDNRNHYSNNNYTTSLIGDYYEHKKLTLKNFWECTKPCGILTAVFGICLLTSSVTGFLFLFERNLCYLAQTCSNSLLKVLSATGLVIGIVFTFIGFVIVIYTKKDENTKVIITTAKNFDKFSVDYVHNNNNNNNSNQIRNNRVPEKEAQQNNKLSASWSQLAGINLNMKKTPSSNTKNPQMPDLLDDQNDSYSYVNLVEAGGNNQDNILKSSNSDLNNMNDANENDKLFSNNTDDKLSTKESCNNNNSNNIKIKIDVDDTKI